VKSAILQEASVGVPLGLLLGCVATSLPGASSTFGYPVPFWSIRHGHHVWEREAARRRRTIGLAWGAGEMGIGCELDDALPT
jgi:hypothetical protein